ncbi:MAG: glycosyltransferase family 1 protein [bacterium]|nr:glycosyltransferase family 1 protein [bacterium]
MNVLMLGMQFGRAGSGMGEYRSARGHDLRFLGVEGDVDYTFTPRETAADVIARISVEWPVDALVCWYPELFPPPLDVEHLPVKTVAVVSDWNVYPAQLEHNLARYDVVLTDELGSQTLRLDGATPQYLFPLYSQESRIHRSHDVPRDIDILFLGNLNHAVHVQRGRMLEQVAALSDRYRVVIDSDFSKDDYARMLSRAKIVFNHSIRREMNLRCFEAPACGALLFLEESNLEVRDYLVDREHVVLYRPETLVPLLEQYLGSTDETDAIAEAGRERVAGLAMERRLDDLFDWIEMQPKSERAFHDEPEPVRLFHTFLMYASALPDGQREAAGQMLEEAVAMFPEHSESMAAAGCAALEEAGALAGDERKRRANEALRMLGSAAANAPEAIPLWLNLAFACELAEAREPAIRFLEKALGASERTHGNLLMGALSDPYLHAWRWAFAVGETKPEHLWAWASVRLARLHLAQGEAGEAREYALHAMDLNGEIADAYHMAALAEEALDNTEGAAALLEQGLVKTAFDGPYRTDLVRLLHATGRAKEARQLAEDTARLFDACPREADTAARFRELAAD